MVAQRRSWLPQILSGVVAPLTEARLKFGHPRHPRHPPRPLAAQQVWSATVSDKLGTVSIRTSGAGVAPLQPPATRAATVPASSTSILHPGDRA